MLKRVPLSKHDAPLIEWLEKLDSRASASDRQRVLELLRQEPSPAVRNAAAIAAADLRLPDADKFIIRLLRRPELKNQRGTLLYALEELQAKVPLTLLTEIISEGSYEARHHALSLLSKNLETGTASERKMCLLTFRVLANSRDRGQREAAQAAIEMLETTGHRQHASVEV